MRFPLIPAVLFSVALGCAGPPAPDGAVCRDVIHRLCLTPVCAQVQGLIPTGQACEQHLQTKSGCITDEFEFTSPTRDKFLRCRLTLLRASENVEAHPACEDVVDFFDTCPDVVRLLQGIR